MNSDRVFEAAIRTAKNLLGQNLQRTDLTDAATVIRLRELVHSPSLRSALLNSSDTLLAFVLRAVEHVVADQSQTDREIITRLWDVLDDPHLNRALGIAQNSRFMCSDHTQRDVDPRLLLPAHVCPAVGRTRLAAMSQPLPEIGYRMSRTILSVLNVPRHGIFSNDLRSQPP
jgi:hypothetical protein